MCSTESLALKNLFQRKKAPARMRKKAKVPPEIVTASTAGSTSGDVVVGWGRGDVTGDSEEVRVVVSVVTVVNVVVTFLGGGVEVGGGVGIGGAANRKNTPSMVRMHAIMMSQHNQFLVRVFTA